MIRHGGMFGAVCGVCGFALGCGVWPGLVEWALGAVSLPVMGGLHRLTAGVAFPVAEPLALALLSGMAWTLLAAMANALRRRDRRPLGRWLLGLGRGALAVAAMLAALWLPARGVPFDAPPTPDADQLNWLCDSLIEQLNAEPPGAADVDALLRQAPRVAGAGRAVKAIRYPEWMRSARISGLFVPLTGEALVDAGVPSALVPFTAVHELMHLTGIADEGAANIAAWDRCLPEGGAFAASARLWALRYAMGQLRERDPVAWRRVRAKMEPALARGFDEAGAELVPKADSTGWLPGLLAGCGQYGALTGHLILTGIY